MKLWDRPALSSCKEGGDTANKRMFSLSVIDTDKFMDMPTSAQALYFHLGMHGDDDGFVASPKKIARAVGCNNDDLRLLAAKGYVVPFESGVVVIVDWRVNNTLKNDRYRETMYMTEKSSLRTDCHGRYTLVEPERFQSGSTLEPEHNITELSIGKGADKPPSPSRFVPPTFDEVADYCRERKNKVDPQCFVDFYEANGLVQGRGKLIKDWKAAVRTWERRDPQAGSGTAETGRLIQFVNEDGETVWRRK